MTGVYVNSRHREQRALIAQIVAAIVAKDVRDLVRAA